MSTLKLFGWPIPHTKKRERFFFLLLYFSILCVIQSGFSSGFYGEELNTLDDDTLRVNQLIENGRHFCSQDNQKALVYLQEAFTISTSLGYQKGIGNSFLWLGRVYYYKDEYTLANSYLQKAVDIFRNIEAFDLLSFTYYSQSEIDKLNGNYIQAFKKINAALEANAKTTNKIRKSVLLCSMGSLLLKREKSVQALSYFREALLVISDLENCELHKSSLYTHLGIVHEQNQDLDSALFYYNQGLALRTVVDDRRNIASSKHSIGTLLIKRNAFQEAEVMLDSAYHLYEVLNEKTGMCLSLSQVALAKSYLNQPDAILLANKVLIQAQKIGNPWLLENIYGVLSEITYQNQQYQASVNYLRKQTQLSDSLFTAEKERLLTEYEIHFQSERKDLEIDKLKSKTQNQRINMLFLTFFAGLLLALIVLLSFLFKYKSTILRGKQVLLEKESIISGQRSELVEKENLLLKRKLESKNRELASKALEMIRFNDTISVVIRKLENFDYSDTQDSEKSNNIKNIIFELENQTKHNIWLEFDKIFKNIHSGFYERLLKICPDLSPTEIKMAALLKLNLTTKEIAAITFKSEGGIKTSRYRLRKKLHLSSDKKLIPFLLKI